MAGRVFDQITRPAEFSALFSELAASLEVRHLARFGAAASSATGERVCLAFDAPGPDVLSELEIASSDGGRALQVTPGKGSRPDAEGASLSLLTGQRAALAALAARGSQAAAALLAAHDAAHRPTQRSLVMGIVNVTPDSFSDGGAHFAPGDAVQQGLKLLSEGAEMLDVGGESTRPGAPPVSPSEELERVVPVVRGLRARTDAPISIDTTKASVAEACLDAGATLVNDVSAGRMDADMLPLVARRDAELILMHMQGTPRDMQAQPSYHDVVREVVHHLRERVRAALDAGVAPERLALDPGIGFGKRLRDNLDLLRALPELRSLGLPIVLGVSRKSFLGALAGTDEAEQRDLETVAATALGANLGADIHRVHDAGAAQRALAVADALRSSEETC